MTLSALLILAAAALSAAVLGRMAGCGRTFLYAANSASEDISAYRVDEDTGGLEQLGETKAGGQAGTMTVSRDLRTLYVFLRTDPPSVAAFALDSATGGLEPLGAAAVPADLSAISLDATGRFLFGASYSGNCICVMPVGPGGLVQPEAVGVLRPGRNAHAILADPSNRFVFVPCLGSDHVSQFIFNEKTGALVPNRPAVAAFQREAGPRHFRFSPDSRFVYVLTELSGEVATFALDAESGVLTEKASIPILPPEIKIAPGTYTPPLNGPGGGTPGNPMMWAADIHITPDGRFLYTSERATSRLSRFRIDAASGRVDFVDCMETEEQPRGFGIDPKGRYLAAVGERSHHVTLYAIDRGDGKLRQTARQPAGTKPNWVEFVNFR